MIYVEQCIILTNELLITKSIVEEISQAPCAMSSMEALQYCHAWRNELLSTTRFVDPSDTNSITLDLDQSTCRIPCKVDFQNKVTSHGKNIFQTIVYEGASTCVMSFKCWQALGSLTLVQSHIVRKAFDGNSFSPHGLIVSCSIEWGGKIVTVDVSHIPYLLKGRDPMTLL